MFGTNYSQTEVGDYSSRYNIFGNQSIDKAEVVAITETHDNQDNRRENIGLVNSIFNGHLIVVELNPINEIVDSSEHAMTKGLLHKATVFGGDLPGFREELAELNERNDRIKNLTINVLRNVNKLSFYLTKTDSDFESLIALAPKKVRVQKNEILLALRLNSSAAVKTLTPFINAIDLKHAKKLTKFRNRTLPGRQACLEKAISQGLESHGKVIVLFGKSHIIEHPLAKLLGNADETKSIQDYLNKKKFVVISYKDPSEPTQNIPSLWSSQVKPKETMAAKCELSAASDLDVEEAESNSVLATLHQSSASLKGFSLEEQVRVRSFENAFQGALSDNPETNRMNAKAAVLAERFFGLRTCHTTIKIDEASQTVTKSVIHTSKIVATPSVATSVVQSDRTPTIIRPLAARDIRVIQQSSASPLANRLTNMFQNGMRQISSNAWVQIGSSPSIPQIGLPKNSGEKEG